MSFIKKSSKKGMLLPSPRGQIATFASFIVLYRLVLDSLALSECRLDQVSLLKEISDLKRLHEREAEFKQEAIPVRQPSRLQSEDARDNFHQHHQIS